MVVDKAGYILTNNHVVDKADRIQVKFTGRSHRVRRQGDRRRSADRPGGDPRGRQARIRVPAKIGNSDAVQVGDWCIAIGSPFGFQATVTAGIISAKERDVDPSMQFQHFLQTDAAINPGNSGGPLLNIRGEVIGINTAIASRSGGYQGIGFALPVNTAAKVYNDIIKNGKVTRGSIGITFTPSDTDAGRALLKSFGAKEGVFVQYGGPGRPVPRRPASRKATSSSAINGKPVKEAATGEHRDRDAGRHAARHQRAARTASARTYKVVVGDLAQIFPERSADRRTKRRRRRRAGVASFGMKVQNLSEPGARPWAEEERRSRSCRWIPTPSPTTSV